MLCKIIKGLPLSKDFEDANLFELRLDTLPSINIERLKELIVAADKQIIATCRFKDLLTKLTNARKVSYISTNLFELANANFRSLMNAALSSGADFVDIEHDMPANLEFEVLSLAKTFRTSIIRSYHGECPESIDGLLKIYNTLYDKGTDFIKIVVDGGENERKLIKSLYSKVKNPERLVAFVRGPKNLQSRYASLRYGAPWMYVLPDKCKDPENGIPTISAARKRIYGEKYASNQKTVELYARSSKSIIQRMIILSALGTSISRIKVVGHLSTDIEDAISAVQQIGASVQTIHHEKSKPHITELIVQPPAKFKPTKKLNVGESGFVARMFMSIIPAINSGEQCTFYGNRSIIKRNFDNDLLILEKFGVLCKPKNPYLSDNSLFTIGGKLKAGTYTIKNPTSSQLISGLAIAFSLLGKPSTIVVNDLKSLPYLQMTDRLLKMVSNTDIRYLKIDDFVDFGKISNKCMISCSRNSSGRLKSIYEWPQTTGADWSGILNHILAGVVGKKNIDIDYSFTDTYEQIHEHPDMQFLFDILQVFTFKNDEVLKICQTLPLPFEFDVTNCPDSAIAISIYALMCNGKSTIKGISRLTNKESDRLQSIKDTIAQLGGKVIENVDNSISINGMSYEGRLLSNKMLKGGEFRSFGDHRVIMALKLAEMFADKLIKIDDTAAIRKSYPAFFNDAQKIEN